VTYQFYDICVSQPDASLTLGGTQDNGTDRWTGTTTWANGLGADGMVCNCSVQDASRVYGEIQFGDHRRSNSGGTSGSWFSINSGITGSGAWVTAVEIDPTNHDVLFTATSDGIFRTTDGTNWSNVLAGFNANSFSVSPVDPNIVWATSGGPPKYSTDGGATWNDAAPFGFAVGATATRVLAHPVDSQTALMTFSTYSVAAHIVMTTDLGATWQDVTGDFPFQPVNAIAIDPSIPTHWFIGTDVGVWASGNGGANWYPFEDNFPNAVVADLEIQNSTRKLRAGTHGRGAWEVDLAPTGVTPAVPQAISLMLDPPHPNPLSDGTILRYAARTPGSLSLRIYDVQGRLVTTVAEHRADGIIREVRWNPGTQADGVYFARLSANGQEKSQKLVVVK
jgi:hypothetical protein